MKLTLSRLLPLVVGSAAAGVLNPNHNIRTGNSSPFRDFRTHYHSRSRRSTLGRKMES